MMNAKPENVDAYIAGFPPETRVILEQIRETIRMTAPDADEMISYAIAGYKLNGPLVYFAGYANHIGFYPGAGGIKAFKTELTGYKSARGSVRFPFGQAFATRTN